MIGSSRWHSARLPGTCGSVCSSEQVAEACTAAGLQMSPAQRVNAAIAKDARDAMAGIEFPPFPQCRAYSDGHRLSDAILAFFCDAEKKLLSARVHRIER